MNQTGPPAKGELLYEGKAKRVYATADPACVVIEYKDDATAFNAKKRGRIEQKGAMNNAISAYVFELLSARGIPTHYIRRLGERETLAWRVEIIPIEVVVRNIAAGSLSNRLGLAEGTPLSHTVIEFYYKNDALQDPMVNRSHVRALGIASDAEMDEMSRLALWINGELRRAFEPLGLVLVDFKVEFGRKDGAVLLADEISPDTCRLWDAATGERLDKDRFRRDLGGVAEAYRQVLERIEGSWSR